MRTAMALLAGLAAGGLIVGSAYGAAEGKPAGDIKPPVTAVKADKPKVELPAAAVEAIKASYPGMAVKDANMGKDKRTGATMYSINLAEEGKEGKNVKRMELRATESGMIVSAAMQVTQADLPKAVMDALTKAADGGKPMKIRRAEIWVDEKMAKLDKPKIQYNTVLFKDDKSAAISIAEDGTVISLGEWKATDKPKPKAPAGAPAGAGTQK